MNRAGAMAVVGAGLAGSLVVLVRSRLVVVAIAGESMLPALSDGDRVLVRRVPLSRVRAGQIVVLAPPADWPVRAATGRRLGDRRWLIKRAVATPGDPVPDQLAATLDIAPGSLAPPASMLVLGDNAERSFDSREMGYVDAGRLLGVVVRRLPIRM